MNEPHVLQLLRPLKQSTYEDTQVGTWFSPPPPPPLPPPRWEQWVAAFDVCREIL